VFVLSFLLTHRGQDIILISRLDLDGGSKANRPPVQARGSSGEYVSPCLRTMKGPRRTRFLEIQAGAKPTQGSLAPQVSLRPRGFLPFLYPEDESGYHTPLPSSLDGHPPGSNQQCPKTLHGSSLRNPDERWRPVRRGHQRGICRTWHRNIGPSKVTG
jgi:hypothetical protein